MNLMDFFFKGSPKITPIWLKTLLFLCCVLWILLRSMCSLCSLICVTPNTHTHTHTDRHAHRQTDTHAPGCVSPVGHEGTDEKLMAVLSSYMKRSIAIFIHTVNLPTCTRGKDRRAVSQEHNPTATATAWHKRTAISNFIRVQLLECSDDTKLRHNTLYEFIISIFSMKINLRLWCPCHRYALIYIKTFVLLV